jgi:ADP-ribose pyrophosphatase YjhB (NUDIX family)
MDASDESLPHARAPRAVVAVVLSWRGRIGLFKRSPLVSGGAGLWHCITGFVEYGVAPEDQALSELREETGLTDDELVALEARGVIELTDPVGTIWRVHTFRAQTERRRLALSWEHDAYRWVPPKSLPRFDGQVPWLRDVLAVVA